MPNMPPKKDTFSYQGWTVETSKGHILSKEQEESFVSDLSLPSLPDMVFSENYLQLSLGGRTVVRLEAKEPLKTVNPTQDLVHVAGAQMWKDARKDSPFIHTVVKPFDWTYTPANYRGSTPEQIRISQSTRSIDYEKLKVAEKIVFFDQVHLYEDELDDNGCASLTAKIRVMPSGFFVLLRFYLRVDRTLFRVHDTRFHHEFGSNFVLREYSERESKFEALNVPPELLTDQNGIVDHLDRKKLIVEELLLS